MIVKNKKCDDMRTTREEIDMLENLIDEGKKVIRKFKQIEKPEKTWTDNAGAEEYLGVSSRTLQNYRNKGLLKFSQVGSKIWYNIAELQDFLIKHQRK
jgi:hypothetical protein